jgi:uncharacterized membrane protein
MRTRAAIGLGTILIALAGTLLFGLAVKASCADGLWTDLKQYRLLCYSDVVPLYGTERLQGDRLPYVNDCHPNDTSNPCDEYPVLTMYTMRLAAWASHSYASFFFWNAVFLSIAAGVTAFLLYRMTGPRALYFALAPTLLLYAFMNWDLIAVAFATAATYWFLRKRDVASGIMLGLGAATKLFPVVLVVPFAAERLRRKDPRGAVNVIAATGVSWLVVDLPFMVTRFHEWFFFFHHNASRPADWDSLWFVACSPGQTHGCSSSGFVNAFSVLAFVVVAVVAWVAKVARQPDTPRWQLGFPILVAFLLTNKVYSPQYGLWLLPWFALVLPDLKLFVAFEAADVAVFVTRFAFFGHLAGGPNGWTGAFSIGWFQLAVVARALVLVLCVVRFVRREPIGARPPVMVNA